MITEALGPENDGVEGQQSRKEILKILLDKLEWSYLNESQKDQLVELVLQHNELFIVDKGELGIIKHKPAHIQVSDPNPIYRYTEKPKDTIAEILSDLENRDIIEPSTAGWLSPIVLVNKSSGEKRMCLDYRKVNTHLATDIHLLPRLEELVENIAGNEYYATLDLKNAYYQVMLDEESRDLTTFTERINSSRFKRLPFGLSCSAAIFVRHLQQALAPLLYHSWIKSYLVDVVICTSPFNALLQRLDLACEQIGIR